MGWIGNSLRNMSFGTLGLGIAVIAAAQPNTGSETTSQAPERPRIAIEATGPAMIGNRLAAALVGRGYPVVDSSWLTRTKDPTVPGAMPRADLIVHATVRAGRERRQQGRYRVIDTVELKAVDPRDGRTLFLVTPRANGESFDGFAEAHEAAIERAFAGGAAPLDKLIATLDGYCDEERRRGLDMILTIRDRTGGVIAATLARELNTIPNIDAASIRAAVPAAHDVVGLRFRYRGASTDLPAAVYERVERIDSNVAVRFASSPRLLAIEIDRTPAPPAPAAAPATAFGRAMDGVVADAIAPDQRSLATRAGRVESTVETPTPLDDYHRVPIVVIGGVRASALAHSVRGRVTKALLDGKVFRELDPAATTVVTTRIERISGSFLLQTAVEDRSRDPSVQLSHHGRIVARPLVRRALNEVLVR